MPTERPTAVFFDIGNTLGAPRISAPPVRILGLDVYPYVPGVLERLRGRAVPIGLLSDIGGESPARIRTILEDCGIYSYLDPALLVYGRKDSPALFAQAAAAAGHAGSPERCLFVGEDATERNHAQQAGLRVAPHPLLAESVLDGSPLRYVRVSAPAEQGAQDWRQALRQLPLVPLQVAGAGGTQVLAVTTAAVAARLDDLGFAVDRLGAEGIPSVSEVYLLRDDRQVRTGFLHPEGQSASFFADPNWSPWILGSSQEGIYLALPAGRSIDELHFSEAQHGHTLQLLPDSSLLEPFGTGAHLRSAAWLTAVAEPDLDKQELMVLAEIGPNTMRKHLRRYTGAEPLLANGGVTIRSRHSRHPDNARVVEALVHDLQQLAGGVLAVRVHAFSHEGRTLHNVEAELPGQGAEGIVIVSAHLDSTAAFGGGPYNPRLDPAPGADDDASGVAAVLTIAAALARLAVPVRPRRTLRFVLFNAEEQGLIGSKAYARDQAAAVAPLVAVYQMDMIGYRSAGAATPRPFEVHAGYAPSPDVAGRSLVLARRLERLAARVSPGLVAPQIYTHPDPASGRSDHASFHERGYAACAVTEDFFIGPVADSPAPQPNPHYHKPSDREVNLPYAADLARLVAAAAWVSAKV